MTDDIWRRDEIDSPCRKVCVVHPQARICIGCFRTLDEIRDWSAMSAAQRAAVMAELPGREGLLATRRGGRAGRAARRGGGTG